MMCVLLSFVVGARILMCGFVICCMGIKKWTSILYLHIEVLDLPVAQINE